STESLSGRHAGSPSDCGVSSVLPPCTPWCRSRHSRCQALPNPGAVRVALVPDPVVQPIGPALPEFEFDRAHTVAAPGRRTYERRAVGLAIELGQRALEIVASLDDDALIRHEGAELTAAGTDAEVLVRLGIAGELGDAMHAHLALQHVPEK